ncbi:muconate/chloromuconate cycloisomerase [Bacillus niacini]|uniref:Muconate/chloromuconate cycloisomerase n=1 Tax=Neobacillus niacini TaxID=86668 RepID=A0A852TAF7_9BACI|nr:enolase C-terminal domain-like protein [Neobacillus niacini]NYE05733.1 muconate/chloromuconate cycloisomerase [Neobacillus niacini]
MKIVDIETIAVRVPLIKPFKAAYGVRDTADFVLVKVFADNGLEGIGEAATIPIYDEGSQASAVFAINRYLKPLLIGQDPRKIGLIHEMMDKAIKGERYAKSAVDYALYELTAKYFNLPVYQLLGGKNRDIQVTAVLSAGNTEEIVTEVTKKKEAGYKVFKLKIGTDHTQDLERVRLIREAIGYDVDLRLDGNEGWRGKEAVRKAKDIEEYNPSHLEQPVPNWDLEGLKYLRENSSIPIVIDESVLTLKDAYKVIKYVGGDILNIKTARSGGLFPSLKIAATAEAAGVTPLLGSMLELGIGTIANAHFAASLTGTNLATELVGPQFVKKDILREDIVYENGYLVLPEGPGWGVEIDRDMVKEFTVTL